MKHNLLTAIIMALFLVPSISHAQDFSAENDDGVRLYYYILSEEEKTCGVAYTSMEDDYVYTGDIDIPSTANGYKVTSITEYAFDGTSITSVTIPNTVTTIERWAFSNCSALKTANIGEVETIKEEAFKDCTSLETLIVGKSLKSVDYSAFHGCTSLSHLEINTPIVEPWFSNFPFKTVTLGDNVKEINGAFWTCGSLTTINIPNSVTSIGNCAFQYCGSLSSIEIPESVTSIGMHAFENCGLTSINIPATVTDIGYGAFQSCDDLKSVKIGETNSTSGYSTSIGEYAFGMCSGIESVFFGNSVASIGEHAFFGCSSLGFVEIPSSVTNIGYAAFQNCSSLAFVSIPNSVSIINDGTFANCTSLTEIELPNSIEYIGLDAFCNCKKLAAVVIPKSVTAIALNPFTDCTSLESIIVEEDNEKYNSVNGCNAIIETSSGTLIAGCMNTVIPKTIKAIGFTAFSGCVGLSSVTIPSTVTAIGKYAFFGCTNLSTVYSEITDFFDIDKSVFQGSENTTLYVPKGMATTYRASTGWSVIKYIEEMPDDTPEASFLISCSGKGSVSINGSPSITNKISASDINEGTDNTFTFTPKPGCKLEQVILNGLDITANVEGNTLTCIIPANSQMIVTFSTEQGDMNNDGRIDISDVVAIVNKILGN